MSRLRYAVRGYRIAQRARLGKLQSIPSLNSHAVDVVISAPSCKIQI